MKQIEKYFEKHKIRYFLEFPEDKLCPICGTNEKDYCILIGIDGTANENNEQAAPVHVHCLITNKNLRYNREVGVIYYKQTIKRT